jgi:hypothetical protein
MLRLHVREHKMTKFSIWISISVLWAIIFALTATNRYNASSLRLRNLSIASAGSYTIDPSHVETMYQLADELREKRARIWDIEEDPNRPTIYTFFQPYDSIETDYEAIAAWKHAWSQAGWNPHIISLEQVKAHPRYAEIEATIKNFGYNDYESVCFLRHFAMAMTGGIMADFDSLPLHFPPEKYGETPTKFTSYHAHVPAIMGGTKAEWERVAWLLLKEAVEHHRGDTSKDVFPFSDMFALSNLVHKDLITYTVEAGHCNAIEMCKESTGEKLRCDWLKENIRVIHVSHKFMKDAGIPLEYRGVAMGDAMQKYHDQCNGPDFYNSAALYVVGKTNIHPSTITTV